MNYIELINRFWSIDLEANFSHLEVHLFFKLLEINNRLGWKDSFRFPNSRLEAEIGSRQKNLINARQRLVDKGVISYKKGTTRDAGIYKLLSKNQSFVPTKESNQESNEESNQGNKTEVIEGTLNKQNETIEDIPPKPPKEEKLKKTRKKREQPEKLEFPFQSKEFMDTWEKLCSMPKWKKKLNLSLQMALNSLGKLDEEFAMMQMRLAIEGNWQGVTFSDTQEKFEKWKNQKYGTTKINPTITKGKTTADAAASIIAKIEATQS